MKSTITLFVLLLALAAPTSAGAVGLTGAQNAAYWESTNYCPHHTLGKCMARRSTVEVGIGGGWWVASAEDWECIWGEPCSFNAFNTQAARLNSRWYGCEEFKVTASGGITQRHGC